MNDLSAAFAASRPRSMEMFARARQYLAGAVGHDLRYFEPTPLYIARAQGGRKWDVDDHPYVDFLMGNGALLLGHADPEVVEAIRAAAPLGTHFGNDHPLHIAWAELVTRLMPAAERVRFVNSGSEATLLAIRVARAYTSRTKLLRFVGHFHGWHDEVVHGFRPPFDADGSLGVPARVRDDQIAIPDNDLVKLDEVLAREPDVAAVIIEPSGASWGRVPLAEGFLAGLREITRRRKVLLIFDEVVTGFRFGPGGVQTLTGVVPDLACLAKVLAGGMPGGAVVGSAEVMSVFDFTGDADHDRHRRVTHLGTFNGSPLSAAAGIATLMKVARGDAIEKANNFAVRLRERWNGILEQLGIAGYVYGPASTFHVYFETDRERIRGAGSRADLETTDPDRLKGMPGELITAYQRLLRSHGVDIMSSTGGVTSSAHDDEDLDRASHAFQQTVQALRDAGLVHTLP